MQFILFLFLIYTLPLGVSAEVLKNRLGSCKLTIECSKENGITCDLSTENNDKKFKIDITNLKRISIIEHRENLIEMRESFGPDSKSSHFFDCKHHTLDPHSYDDVIILNEKIPAAVYCSDIDKISISTLFKAKNSVITLQRDFETYPGLDFTIIETYFTSDNHFFMKYKTSNPGVNKSELIKLPF